MMEIENVQFTLEQILNIHRSWITKLYVQECKSEEEIVSILGGRGFQITVAQLHRCLASWSLVTPSSRSSTTLQSFHCYPNVDGYPIRNLYEKDLLRRSSNRKSSSLDAAGFKSWKKSENPDDKHPSADLLKVMCYHGEQCHESRMHLGYIPRGPSQLEVYWTEDQRYERVAMGLALNGHEAQRRRLKQKLSTPIRGKDDAKKKKSITKRSDAKKE
ncbi:hypothetical protein F5884DRAFT_322150 [Xylogone sp. PMI_703]|nr:hypothetical protein F5884DRAFT_322150 [Xylogone sp. PMI_703]